MASLREYFIKDGSQNLTCHETWHIKREDGSIIIEIVARLHFDFDARAKYVSFYVPGTDELVCPEALVLRELPKVLAWPETQVSVAAGFGGERSDGKDLIFTGRIYLYSERPLRTDLRERLEKEAKSQEHNLIFRSIEYMNERNRWEKPRAFISHDSRDKTEIAEPLAIKLQQMMCPVWYDEFSLKVGDSLRGSIETGLKECSKCVLILTQNFLSNEGWSKREYDSVFTRELVENSKVILPVWHGVRPSDVYKYSPVLADRVAVQWSRGVDEVAQKLLGAINA